MVAGCGANCMKYTLFFFNIIFFLLGLCLVAVGAYLLFMMEAFGQMVTQQAGSNVDGKQYVMVLAVVFLVAGLFLMALCFFGCCGAIKEVKCLLGTYAVLIILVIIGQLVIIAKVVMFKDTLYSAKDLIKSTIADNVRNYKGDGSDIMMDQLHQTSMCCGDDSWEDYKNKAKDWERRLVYQIPLSCCMLQDSSSSATPGNLVSSTCPLRPTSANSYIDRSCGSAITQPSVLKQIFIIVIAVTCGILAIELIGLIFSICLIRMIGDPRAVPV